MSRYPPADYRGSRDRDRSRSPPRFSDRRASAQSIFERPPAPPRNASDAPRGPRSQFDGPRPPLAGGPGPGAGQRPGYSSLRDAPPLGTTERGRPFRDREYDRRDRVPSPRERSPPRNFKDPRDFPPRDLDIGRARRGSRDGPPSAGSTFSDTAAFASAPPFRGGFSRGRGRGDFEFRGGRGGRRGLDDRDLFRRDRSPPPPRWGRDLSRDGREPDRNERRFERREEDSRPEWTERDREVDRAKRDQPPPRLEARQSSDSSVSRAPPYQQPPAAPQIDPGRLALLESAGADLSVRRPSVSQNAPPASARREVPETPSYLNGRAETTANRYNQRGSSPPTQAPPVPAFTLSFAPSAPASGGSASSAVSAPMSKPAPDTKSLPSTADAPNAEEPPKTPADARPEPPQDAPTAPKAPPPAPKAQLAEPPPTAPKAPRALENDLSTVSNGRLQGIRSFENLKAPPRPDAVPKSSPTGPVPMSPAAPPPPLAALMQPVVPNPQATARFGELGAPTGPRATRMSPAQVSVSPRPTYASPRSDTGGFQGFGNIQRGTTPPPSAPSGPRNRSFSVSPKVPTSTVPTAPKADRAPPVAPRAAERGPAGVGRGTDRLGAPPPWAPPAAPRGLQWNQWRRPPAPGFNDRVVPAKRDFAGEEKERQMETAGSGSISGTDMNMGNEPSALVKSEDASRLGLDTGITDPQSDDRMDVDAEAAPPKSATTGHSAAQSFFGKPVDSTEEEPGLSDAVDDIVSSSEDDEIDYQEELALFNAKYERQRRALESQLVDLSSREYRATTPLESIARLARISEKDLQRLSEHQEMDLDESHAIVNNHLMPPATRSSDSDDGPDLLTPKGEEDTRVAVRDDEDVIDNIRRIRRASPEVISLPYLTKNAPAFQESEEYQGALKQHDVSRPVLLSALQEQMEDDEADAEDNEVEFAEQYRRWREECEDMDREREELDRIDRQLSAEPGPEPDAPAMPPLNPIVEGRRLHKFSSEYDIEQVIKQSEETARIEQEKQERESKRMQADMEKEARLPDQQTHETFKRHVFVDANRLRDPESLTLVFSYEPPVDTFTEKEQQIFIGAFKETPKKWGEIASLLPGRSYKDCIHHYYANKWDGRFRDNRTKKLKAGGRRGRGGKGPPRGRGSALMADLGRAEDLSATPNVSDSGRPKRAAAPTTFGERETEAKAALTGPSPAKKPGPASKQDNGEVGPEKPGKRRKGMGEKPGRKAKANPPLAALAAAPIGSPNKQYLHGLQTKEELARAQSLEDASLLAGLQSGHHGLLSGEGQMVYHQEGYGQPLPATEEPGRPKPVGQHSSSKPSASSYWSVPEQTDFAKYIAHFGTDFAAIASHMGTKTQTMIKNHYQRQIDAGNRPELQMAAKEADRRRELGEDMGPPPTPTPIVKRKYDNPPPPAPRPLAPHTDAMEVDDPGPAQRAPIPKHASPPQFQAQPRFTPSDQATPVQAPRVVQSPAATSVAPVVPQSQPQSQPQNTTPAPPMQHPLGARLAFLSDSRPESRPGLQATSSFRLSQETPPRGTPQLPPRSVPDPPDPQYIRNLVQEQERALRMQQEQSQQERMDQLQRQSSLQHGSAQGSPATQALPNPPERKPLFEERAPTPPRSTFPAPSLSRAAAGQPMFAQLGPLAYPTSLIGRSAFNPSPPKKEEPRPSSVPTAPLARPPAAAAPPEPPKRSNLLSILNSEPDEPKPPKREAAPSAPPRNASPAPFQGAPTPASSSNVQARREMFGQPSMPQSQFQRSSFSQPSQPPGPSQGMLKQEPSARDAPLVQASKQDWTTRMYGSSSQSNQSNPSSHERERAPPLYSHRALMGSLNQPTRANPSPPPHAAIGHSRTPSLTGQPTQPPREQRPGLPNQQQQQQHAAPQQPLQPNPYGGQGGGTSFSQPAQPQAQNHPLHSHSNSLGGNFAPPHHRAPSRDDSLRQQQEQAYAALREREEEWRRRQEAVEIERQREAQYHAQRQQQQQQQEQERQQQERHQQERHQQERHQQAFARGPPPPPQGLHPSPFGGQGFAAGRMQLGLREQSLRETEAAMEEQRRLQQQDTENRRRHEAMMREREREIPISEEEYRRRQEGLFPRRTPLGGGYGIPPPRR